MSLKRATCHELLTRLGYDQAPSAMGAMSTVLTTALAELPPEAKADLVRHLQPAPADPRDVFADSVLADLRTLRDAAAARAPETLGAAIQLCVSGNGEAWGVYLNDTPLTKRSCETPFGGALHEAAEFVRQNPHAR